MRILPRNNGRILWVLVAVIFVASLALAGWVVLANRIDTAGLTAISQWTPRHIAHDPHGFIQLCQQRLDETAHLADSAGARLAGRRAEIARAVDDSQPQLRLANQKRVELRAVYEWAQANGRWPVRYGGAQLDPQALKAAMIGTTRYMQALQGASGQVQQSLGAIDARVKKIQAIGKEIEACRTAARADLDTRPPLPQENVDKLAHLGERIEGLRRSIEELVRPVEVQLPADVPAAKFDENEFARVLADGK